MFRRMTRRKFLREGWTLLLGTVIATLTLQPACKSGTTKPIYTKPYSPGGLPVYYDTIHPYGWIITPGCAAKIPMDRLYSNDKLWVKSVSNDRVQIGLTDGFILSVQVIKFISLHEVGDEIMDDLLFGSVEGLKMNVDLQSPIHGMITKCNTDIESTPSKINCTNYDGGWLIEVRMDRLQELDTLMTPDQFAVANAK